MSPTATPETRTTSAASATAVPESRLAAWQAAHDVQTWLVAGRNAGRTPADITTDLVASGWSADVAASTALRSLRRSDRNNVLYGSLCWSAGLAAVGFTTGVHQLLSTTPNRPLASLALTVSVVAMPIAVVAAVFARRVERRSPHAVWSPARRAWFGTLAACTAVVGIVRLVTYVYAVIASLTQATTDQVTGQDLAQVLVSLAVAVPLFTWSFVEWRRSNIVISGLNGATTDDDGLRS